MPPVPAPRTLGTRHYEQQKKRHENKHHQAFRALAYKLTRIYFACWRDRQAYQPEKYLQALQTNGSPLHKALETQPQKNCE